MNVQVATMISEIQDLASSEDERLQRVLSKRLAKLELFVDGWLTAAELFKRPAELSEELSLLQTDRLRFVASSSALYYFRDDHPIKAIFLDAIKFQTLVDKGGSQSYAEIMRNFLHNLELSPFPVADPVESSPFSQVIDPVESIVDQFIQEPDLLKAYYDLQVAVVQLTGKQEAGADDTVPIYHRIAQVGYGKPHFIYKLLGTCEGLDPKQQDRFLLILYVKTSLISMMESF